MKKIIFGIVIVLGIMSLGTVGASAHSGNHNLSQDSDVKNTSTDSGVLEGKLIQEKIKSKEISCNSLKDNDFYKLGDYYMDQMTDIMGKDHESMDSMMENMIGKDKNREMHIVMGKRFSGCDTSVKFSMSNTSFMTTMMKNMMGNTMGKNMMGNWSNPNNKSLNNSMMSFSYGSMGILGWLWMILWWVLVIIGIVSLVRWFNNKNKSNDSKKSAIDILRERYAKGELTKHEFESMKKEIE